MKDTQAYREEQIMLGRSRMKLSGTQFSKFILTQFLIASAVIHPGCVHTETEVHKLEVSGSTAPTEKFYQTMAGYMAELGQYKDDVYRFWDNGSTYEIALQRLDLMVEIHDSCLLIYEDYLVELDDPVLSKQGDLFKDYLIKSRQLTKELKKAILTKDQDKIEAAFKALDRNRRNAHTTFG